MYRDICSFVARLRRSFVVLASLSLVSFGAFAGTAFTLNAAPLNPGVLPGGGGWVYTPGSVPNQIPAFDPPPNRVYRLPPAGGGALVEEVVPLAGRAGNLPVQVRQSLTVLDGAAAIARCLSRPICAAAVAVAAAAGYKLYERYRAKPAPDGGLVADPGQPQVPSTSDCWQGGGRLECYPTPLAVAEAEKPPTWTLGPVEYRGRDTACVLLIRDVNYSENHCYGRKDMTVTQCPPVVDFYDPAYSVPGGPPGPDGKCPTGVYSERLSPEEASKKVAAYPPPVADTLFPQAVSDAVQLGGESVPSTISTSGPASQIGSSVKTSTTDGSGTTTKTETPTYSYHYDGDTVTYDLSTHTTVTHPDGSTTSTTTTTEGTKPAEDQADLCTQHPDILACAGLGQAPADKIPTASKSVEFTAEALALPAACPAPVQLPHGQSISYQTLCDGLTQTRPLIIAIGFLIAGGIMVAALRS